MHGQATNKKPPPDTGCRQRPEASFCNKATVSFTGVDWEVEREKSSRKRKQIIMKKNPQVSIVEDRKMVPLELDVAALIAFSDVAGAPQEEEPNALKIRNLDEASHFFDHEAFKKFATATGLHLKQMNVKTDTGKRAALKHIGAIKDRTLFSGIFCLKLKHWKEMAILKRMFNYTAPPVLPITDTRKAPSEEIAFSDLRKKDAKHAFLAGKNEVEPTKIRDLPTGSTAAAAMSMDELAEAMHIVDDTTKEEEEKDDHTSAYRVLTNWGITVSIISDEEAEEMTAA